MLGGTLNPAARRGPARSGGRCPRARCRIAADGEILLRGPAGVPRLLPRRRWRRPRRSIRRAGCTPATWGTLTADGYLRDHGRKKDLIITSSGKNVTPANIESALRETRWISEAVVYGDHRPYLVALVTLDRDEAAKLAEQLGIPPNWRRWRSTSASTRPCKHDVDEVNKRFARIEQIKRFAILDHDLTQNGGELTPTLKVKRNVVYGRYADYFNDLYGER